ncbi:MAG: helix-turn-helix domain-containing protein [Pasteurellaceae bacterium]|nr:helix-turn-helix domain-containing protein [Pasteurellaceae bacterium]
MTVFDSSSIIERMMKIEQVKSARELAERIGVEAGTLSKWKTRNSLPVEQIILFAERNQISTDWLLFGEEKKEQLAQDEAIFLAAFRQLDPTQRATLILQMSGLDKGADQGKIVQNGDGGNNNQVFHGNVREVTGIRK